MASLQPRIQAPGRAARGSVFEVRTLASHPMETGLRHDEAGRVIPRKLINRIVCRYGGVVVFDAELREGMAANPYLSFFVRAGETGVLQVTWEEDGGAAVSLESALVVEG